MALVATYSFAGVSAATFSFAGISESTISFSGISGAAVGVGNTAYRLKDADGFYVHDSGSGQIWIIEV